MAARCAPLFVGWRCGVVWRGSSTRSAMGERLGPRPCASRAAAPRAPHAPRPRAPRPGAASRRGPWRRGPARLARLTRRGPARRGPARLAPRPASPRASPRVPARLAPRPRGPAAPRAASPRAWRREPARGCRGPARRVPARLAPRPRAPRAAAPRLTRLGVDGGCARGTRRDRREPARGCRVRPPSAGLTRASRRGRGCARTAGIEEAGPMRAVDPSNPGIDHATRGGASRSLTLSVQTLHTPTGTGRSCSFTRDRRQNMSGCDRPRIGDR